MIYLRVMVIIINRESLKRLHEDKTKYKLKLAQLKEDYSIIITEQHHSSMEALVEEKASSLTSLSKSGTMDNSKEKLSEEEQDKIAPTKILKESRLLDDIIYNELYPKIQDIKIEEVTESERIFQNL